ncbi:MAG: hypothetical protein ACREE0_08890 [Phenylobacterium sp.]
MQYKPALRRLVALVALAGALATSGCFVGDENNWASRKQIVEAAARCGVLDFEPTKIGDGWAAYVDETVPQHQTKEDCIYADLKKSALLATR